MKGIFVRIAAGLLILVLGPGARELRAQLWTPGAPGEDIVSLNLLFGSLQPQTTFNDGSVFEAGSVIGTSVTVWAGRNVGFRGNLVRSKTNGHNDVDEWTAIAVNDPTVWLFSGEAMVRYPMGGASLTWFPYLSAGVGGKTYQWAVKPEGDTAEAYTAAGGIELRPAAMGPFGLQVELRYHRSGFRYFGHQKHYHNYDLTQTWGEKLRVNDLVLTAGFTTTF